MTGKPKTTTTPATRTRTTRTPRRTVDLAPDPLDTPAAVAAVAEEPAAAPARQRRAPATRKPKAETPPPEPPPAAAPEPTHAPEPPAVSNPDAKQGEEYPGEPTFKMTVNIPISLHQRASGIVRNAEFTGEPEEITSLTDLVRNSLADLVTHYEKKYNEGAPFPAPKRLRRGRRGTS